jgi:hypothetical protein
MLTPAALAAISALATAVQLTGNAEAVFATFKSMSEKGASWEDIAEAMRNMTVSSEADAQAAINKIPG